MKSRILLAIVVVLAGYGVVKASSIYKARTGLAERMEYRLDFVDDTSLTSVKQDLIHDAGKLGITLRADDIEIVYEDTAVESMAQRLVGPKTGMQFANKRITIRLRYRLEVLGFGFHQELSRSKIRQVIASLPAREQETQRVLDSLP